MVLHFGNRVWDQLYMMFRSFRNQKAKKHTSRLRVSSFLSVCVNMEVWNLILSSRSFHGMSLCVFVANGLCMYKQKCFRALDNLKYKFLAFG